MKEEEKRKIAIEYLVDKALSNPVNVYEILRAVFRMLHTDSDKQFEWVIATKYQERVGDKRGYSFATAGMMRKENIVTALIGICEAYPEVEKRVLEALQKKSQDANPFAPLKMQKKD